MDPNETLRRIRELYREANAMSDNRAVDLIGELAEKIEALDEWLCSKGFLPESWAR